MSGKKLILFTAVLLQMIFSGCKAKKPVVQSPEPGIVEVLNKIPKEAPEAVEIEKEISGEVEVVSPVRIAKKGPFVMREFRAAWIATVANINWPSKSGLSTKEQQREALVLLDFLKEHNYNAVIFQVRPQADAFYESDLEPWSFFLTGEEGKAPDPYYDPLNFWIEAAHDRGLELHVWLNPYRAHHTTGGKITETSVVKTRPELVVQLKNGMWWLDPSKKATQDYT
ncbi:MAG TPA: family 10 glycosylhydrolase, partial [Gillisia sp.]|nr:family 10 glycosylhydrolase [Gillisia sp.]